MNLRENIKEGIKSIKANKLTKANTPINGSEKKNTAVAPGAAAPRNTIAINTNLKPIIAAGFFVITDIAFSPR